MDNRNDSTHERLNRELARMRTRDVGYWGGWAILTTILALVAFLYTNTPREMRYVTGIAGDSIALPTEDGISIRMVVTVEGRQREISLPSQLVYPAKGDEVCLRAGVHRWTGHTSYVSVSKTLCDAPSATRDVD